jgi:hypothetical protein
VVGEGFPPVDERSVPFVLIEAGQVADELSKAVRVSRMLGQVLSPAAKDFVEGIRAEVQSDMLEVERHDVPRGWHRCEVEGIEQRACRSSARAVRGLAVVG